jgi:hypothetical protein
MARRKLNDRNVRKLSRSGNGSMYVTLPVEEVRKLKWKERQKVVVRRIGKRLIIKDWKK